MNEADATVEPGPDSAPASADPATALEVLRARLQARQDAGDYPADLDAQLENLAQVVRSRAGSPALDSALARMERAGEFSRGRINYDSRRAMGRVFHKIVGRLARRQTEGVLSQAREYAVAVTAVVNELAEQLVKRETMDSLSRRVDLVMDRLSRSERRGGADAPDVAELEAQLRAVRAQVDRNSFSPWYSQESFEERFRGTREDILAATRRLAEWFHGCAPVLDFGCGRGEMLELLAAAGIEAHGVDIDPELVDGVRQRGLSASAGDAMEYLKGVADEGLGGLFLGQVIEHLTVQDAADLVALASTKLRRGGRLIIETPNNQSLYVFSHSFYVDPTHVRPVPPSYLLFLVQEAGFSECGIEWRSPVPAGERFERVAESDAAATPALATLNANIDRLNESLFGPQDYALIATR